MMYDLIIVGAGPAGITAAIYSARKKLNVLVLSKNIGGWTATTGEIGNYTGFQFITGPELSKHFEDHMKQFENIELHQNVEVTCVSKNEKGFHVETSKDEYDGLAVILAMGRDPRMLDVPGEEKYRNMGVTYCATCDGPLFTGKDVAVVGGGNSALDSTLQLMNIANKIYIITTNEEIKGEQVLIDKVKASSKVEVVTKANTKEIKGEKFVKSIIVDVEGQEREISVEGVFVEIGSKPVSMPACGIVERNEWDELIVNEKCETNIPGLLAAGDVTNVPYKQIIVAAGQGCTASLSAFEYLSKL